jgi:hypothetical protein
MALAWVLVLALAAALRAPTVTAAAPYLNYVDEGRVLQRVVQMLRQDRWHPRWYLYPSLPLQGIAAAARVTAPAQQALTGGSTLDRLSPWPPRWYGDVEPGALIVTARLTTLLVSLLVVALTGALAGLVTGNRWTGLYAALLAAVVPALVIRGAVVTVDPWVTLAALTALYAAERAARHPRPEVWAALAGASCGAALCCKYPGAVVALPVALRVLGGAAERTRRWRALLAATLAGAGTVLLSMPGFVTEPERVLAILRRQSQIYSANPRGSLWQQAVVRAEWDQPLERPELGWILLLATLAGWIVALLDRRWRRPVAAWTLFAASLLILADRYAFRPFRNLLPLVPLACIACALLVAWLAGHGPAARRRWLAAAVALALPASVLPASAGYASERAAFEDSRAEAVRWLAPRLSPGDRVLVAAELRVARSELSRLGSVTVLPFGDARRQLRRRGGFAYALGPELAGQGRDLRDLAVEGLTRDPLRELARFGEGPLPMGLLWRGNRAVVYVLARQPAAPAGGGMRREER